MRINELLHHCHNAEMKLKEAFIKTAEYHKTSPEIYYECQAYASLSGEHARYFKKAYERFNQYEAYTVERNDFVPILDEHDWGHTLADDLHYLYLLAKDSEFFCSLVQQASTAINDRELESICNLYTEENTRQSLWLLERISREVMQLLPIAG